MADKDLSFRSYTDLQSLDGLKRQAKNHDPEALETVAKQFESLFINMLMQNSRKANESISKDSYFDSGDTKFYRDMLDQQLSLSLSSGKGIGISEVLVRQLSPDRDKQPSDDVTRQLYEKALDATAKAAIESVAKRANAEQSDRASDSVDSAEMSVPSTKTVQSASTNEVQSSSSLPPLNELPELRPGDFLDAIRAVEAQLRDEPSSSVATVGNQQLDVLPGRFSSPEAFVQGIYPLAQEAAGRLGLDARVLVAQAALETGWGQSLPHHADGSSSFNLFGIKADQRWAGDTATVDTLEFRDGIAQREKAAFRSYDSFNASLDDYVNFIQSNTRYESAVAKANDGSAYLQELQLAGYATDPEYATKITGILNGEILQQALMGLGEA